MCLYEKLKKKNSKNNEIKHCNSCFHPLRKGDRWFCFTYYLEKTYSHIDCYAEDVALQPGDRLRLLGRKTSNSVITQINSLNDIPTNNINKNREEPAKYVYGDVLSKEYSLAKLIVIVISRCFFHIKRCMVEAMVRDIPSMCYICIIYLINLKDKNNNKYSIIRILVILYLIYLVFKDPLFKLRSQYPKATLSIKFLNIKNLINYYMQYIDIFQILEVNLETSLQLLIIKYIEYTLKYYSEKYVIDQKHKDIVGKFYKYNINPFVKNSEMNKINNNMFYYIKFFLLYMNYYKPYIYKICSIDNKDSGNIIFDKYFILKQVTLIMLIPFNFYRICMYRIIDYIEEGMYDNFIVKNIK